MAEDRNRVAAELLRLLDAPSVGPRRLLTLLDRDGTVDAVHDALVQSTKTPAKVREFLANTPIDEYEASIVRTYQLGGDFKLWSDPDYPKNLRLWEGRPPILFYKGDLATLQQRSLALVGRIDPSPEGVAAAGRFARKCVENQIQVISGLAKGIDGASHRGSLAQPPGHTFAVLGHGLDHMYPRENRDLYEKIPQYGALISQFRTGVGPQKWTFPARNEVMCTLALGTVIVEARPRCGSLIQADFSFKHQRPVFVLSRNLRTDDSEWARGLVDKGAHVVESFDQVLEVVERQLEFQLQTGVVAIPMSLFDSSDGGSDGSPITALFDLDGVVVDTREATACALANIASRHTGKSISPEVVQVGGKPHGALAALGVSNAYDVYKQEYDKEFAQCRGEIVLFDPVVRGIKELQANGVRVGAITAQPARRARTMLPEDVRQLFDVFLTYSDTGGKKDQGILRALDLLSASKERAFYMGDQATDLEAARKAGVKGVGVLWGFSTEENLRQWPHDLLLSEPSEVDTSLLGMLFPIDPKGPTQ